MYDQQEIKELNLMVQLTVLWKGLFPDVGTYLKNTHNLKLYINGKQMCHCNPGELGFW